MGEMLSKVQLSQMADRAEDAIRVAKGPNEKAFNDANKLIVTVEVWRDLASYHSNEMEVCARRSLTETRRQIETLQVRENALMIALGERQPVLYLPNGQVVEFPIKSSETEEQRMARGMIPGSVTIPINVEPVPGEEWGWTGELRK